MKLFNGDCLYVMSALEPQSVDMVLCDLPYGTTACKWDSVIPFAPLWEQYNRLVKPGGAIVLTASQPFTTALIASNYNMFKYAWVWEKSRGTGFQDVKHRPLKFHEDVLVFSNGGCSNGSKLPVPYFPQGLEECEKLRSGKKSGGLYRSDIYASGVQTQTNWPRSVLRFNVEGKPIHPTQKPVGLFEYLIRTYTKPGETVLDNCMGSGTTGVACLNSNREFVGIEKDGDYFNLARERLQKHELAIPR